VALGLRASAATPGLAPGCFERQRSGDRQQLYLRPVPNWDGPLWGTALRRASCGHRNGATFGSSGETSTPIVLAKTFTERHAARRQIVLKRFQTALNKSATFATGGEAGVVNKPEVCRCASRFGYDVFFVVNARSAMGEGMSKGGREVHGVGKGGNERVAPSRKELQRRSLDRVRLMAGHARIVAAYLGISHRSPGRK
jgi:hypothetical protein